MSGWTIDIGYMPTLGRLKITPHCPHPATNGQGEPFWTIPLTEVLRQTGVSREQLRAHMDEAERPKLPGADMTQEELCDSLIGDCTGKTVLDIGGYDGRAALQAIRNGSEAAVCLDNEQWRHYGWKWHDPDPLSPVRFITGDFTKWSQPMDVVLFFNVLYHVTDPYGALKHLRTITRERMLLCSLVVWDDRPVWYPREPYEVNPEDDTVYWSPSDAGLKKLLKATGWSDVREVGKTTERLVLECRP